jgi:hypothetical protein
MAMSCSRSKQMTTKLDDPGRHVTPEQANQIRLVVNRTSLIGRGYHLILRHQAGEVADVRGEV